MKSENDLASRYLKWLTDNIVAHEIEKDLTEISTPFTDRFGDGISVYVKKDGRHLLLSDDYALTNNTIALGGNPSADKMDALRAYLAPYDISVSDDGELRMVTYDDRYPISIHLFIQALVAANDMFAPRQKQTNGASIFADDVVTFFDTQDIAYSRDVKLEGQSGIIHQIGFILPKRRKMPERLVYAINKPTSQNVELTLFRWDDIKRKRGIDSQMIAFLNDEGGHIQPRLVNAFNSYGALPVPWSERQKHLDKLVV